MLYNTLAIGAYSEDCWFLNSLIACSCMSLLAWSWKPSAQVYKTFYVRRTEFFGAFEFINKPLANRTLQLGHMESISFCELHPHSSIESLVIVQYPLLHCNYHYSSLFRLCTRAKTTVADLTVQWCYPFARHFFYCSDVSLHNLLRTWLIIVSLIF